MCCNDCVIVALLIGAGVARIGHLVVEVVMITILVLQASQEDSRSTGRLLTDLGLKAGRDFIMTTRPDIVESMIERDSRQLFVTDVWGDGSAEATVEFATRLRAMNSGLVTVLYTADDFPSSDLFDRMVKKDVIGRGFGRTILDFRSGELARR